MNAPQSFGNIGGVGAQEEDDTIETGIRNDLQFSDDYLESIKKHREIYTTGL